MIFNREELYKNVGESEELVLEMVKIFYDDAPNAYNNLKKAIAEKDFESIHTIAHGIKGSAFCINAEEYSEITKKLEVAGIEKNNDLDDMEKELDNQYNKLINELKKILE